MGSLLDNVRKSLFGEPVLQPTDVNSRIAAAGTAFAALIEGVGKAVATTQAELDATSGHIATQMAQTQVDTVQAVITDYDDQGKITDVSVITGKTSALDIAVPPALSFKRVHVEGSFVATQFSAAAHSNVNVNLISAGVSGKTFGGISAGGSVVNANTDVQTAQTQDSSVGSMSMTAVILRKPVTALPKPPLVLKGPKLALTLVGQTPLLVTINPPPAPNSNDPPALYRRSAVIQVQLLKADSSVNPNQTIAIDCAGLDSALTDITGLIPATTGPTTNASGIFYVTVSSTVTSPTDAKVNYALRASLNLVNATLALSL